MTILPLRLWPGVEPSVSLLESESRDGYDCLLIEYNAVGQERVQSYLLIPSGVAPDSGYPALVLLHDHGARFDIGKEKLVRPIGSSSEHIRKSARHWVDANFDGVFLADSLARLGFVVIVPDALYWGSRSSELCRRWSRMQFGDETPPTDLRALKREVYEGQRAVYDSLARRGIVWAEQTLNEDAAAARLLSALECVDSRRIGCAGWSMGGHRAWLLAAFCPEIKGGAAISWMTLKRTQATPPSASDYSMLVPQMRERYDFPDIASWLSPKPFLFLSGREDHLFPEDATAEAFRRMQEIYADTAPGALRTEFFPGGHHCGLGVQQRLIGFLSAEIAGSEGE